MDAWNIFFFSKRGFLKGLFSGACLLARVRPMRCFLPRLGLHRDQIHSIVFPLYRTSANRQPFKKWLDLWTDLKKFETVEFVEVDVISRDIWNFYFDTFFWGKIIKVNFCFCFWSGWIEINYYQLKAGRIVCNQSCWCFKDLVVGPVKPWYCRFCSICFFFSHSLA